MITGSNAPKVLIVGAGPTGLTLGINLLRGGVPCRVIDKLPGRLPWSRALGLHARSQEIFDAMGVLEAVPTARPLPHQYAIAATVVRTGALEAGAGGVPAAPEVWSSVEINQ